MSYTKRQFVTAAFEEIGLASYAYDLTNDELLSACKKLDAMMAMWNAKGIRISYPLPSSPEDTNLDSETNVPDSANEAIYTNLAVKISGGFGKSVSPDTKATAKNAYNTLLALKAFPVEKQLPSMPSGAGNKNWRYSDAYTKAPEDRLLAGNDSTLDF